MKKKTGPPCKILNTTKHLADYKASQEAVVLACVDSAQGDVDTILYAYEGAARLADDLTFAVSYVKDVHSAAGCKHGDAIMFKKHRYAKKSPLFFQKRPILPPKETR